MPLLLLVTYASVHQRILRAIEPHKKLFKYVKPYSQLEEV